MIGQHLLAPLRAQHACDWPAPPALMVRLSCGVMHRSKDNNLWLGTLHGRSGFKLATRMIENADRHSCGLCYAALLEGGRLK